MNTEMIKVAGLTVELVLRPIKNLHIGVYPPSGRVRVAAPMALSEDAVRIAVVTRLTWIKKKQRDFAGQARQSERRYVSGETHYFLGRPLRLVVQEAKVRGAKFEFDGPDRLKMTVPTKASAEQKAAWLASWYRQQLREKVAPRIEKWAARLSLQVPRWGVRQMRTKWGSCNPEKGLIWLNLELAKKPLACLDYVLLHEIAHFMSPRHDEAFLEVLDRNMPSWRQIRADLNALPLSADL